MPKLRNYLPPSEDASEGIAGDSGDDCDDHAPNAVVSDDESESETVPVTPSKTRGRKPFVLIPSTPTPSKTPRGTKRVMKEDIDSDCETAFIPSPTTDSPKKMKTESPNKQKPRSPVAKQTRANGPKTPINRSSIVVAQGESEGSGHESGAEADMDEVETTRVLRNRGKSSKPASDGDVFQSSPLKSGGDNGKMGVKAPAKRGRASVLFAKPVVNLHDDVDEEIEGVDGTSTKGEKSVAFVEDLDPTPFLPVLKMCGVYRDELVDPLLKTTYKHLVFLPGNLFNISWKPDARNDGMILFSGWKDVFPKADYRFIKSVIVFEQYSQSHANLSRIDPTILCAKPTKYGGISRAIHFRGRHTHTVCLSVIRVGESFLLSPKLVGSKYQKMITGTFHSLEYERWVAVLCVIYGVKAIRSQTLGNLVTFSTRVGEYIGRPSSSTTSSSKKNRLFSGFASPASVKVSSSQLSLDVNDRVPVYDARGKKPFSLSSDLGRMGTALPSFEGEPPEGSMALVAYTVTSYTAAKFPDDVSLSFNLLWISVLAADDSTVGQSSMENFWHDDNLFMMLGETMLLSENE